MSIKCGSLNRPDAETNVLYCFGNWANFGCQIVNALAYGRRMKRALSYRVSDSNKFKQDRLKAIRYPIESDDGHHAKHDANDDGP